MKEILPGIYLVPLTLSGFTPDLVNMYIIKTPEGLISIDTGWDSPPAITSLEEQLAEIGAAFSDIIKVLITHGHIDHMGMVPRLKRDYGIQYYLPFNEVDLIKARFTDKDNYLPLTDAFLKEHGVPEVELIPPEVSLPAPLNLASTRPDVLLYGNEEIKAGEYILRVINIPGHTPGHVAYYEPDKKFLFSGDMLLPTIATNAAFHVQYMHNPLELYLHSLQTLTTLEIDQVLPGHEYVYPRPRSRIEELINDQLDKAEVIRRILDDSKAITAYEISRALARSARTGKSNWHKLAGWARRFAVLQTVAHLKALESNGEVSLELRGGIYYFQPLALKPPRSSRI
jgi:glyoxylase-like metal-dependent hydrolase (beta-lactamase superfamily II)